MDDAEGGRRQRDIGERLELCWQLRDQRNVVIGCGIYRITGGFEVCAGCDDGRLMRSRLVDTLDDARIVAAYWRLEFTERGFTKVTE